MTTYEIDDFNGRDTTSKIKIRIDEMNLPDCQDFIIKIDFEKFEKNEIKKSLLQKMSYTPMINEKQKICINCHKDIIIRNSAGDVLFPNKQEILLKQQVMRNSTISCIKKNFIHYNSLPRMQLKYLGKIKNEINKIIFKKIITIRYLECN